MKNSLAAIAAGLLLASCVPSTPGARIQQNPGKFEALGGNHQTLVQQGQITRGMSPDAVFLAWGAPSYSFQGSKNGKTTEQWDYTDMQPVHITGFYGGFGYGCYRHYDGFYNSGCGYGIGPDIAFIPRRTASVWFINNRVDSWERAR